jgi:hypothetical protein
VLAISPRFDPSKLATGALADMIDVYEDQVLGWIVGPAKLMFEHEHSGFAVLALALTYFEPLGQSLTGKFHDSYMNFKRGLTEVYPDTSGIDDEILRQLYSQVRCGMFHRGFAKGLVRITRGQVQAIVMHGDGKTVHSIIVNPWALLENVETHVLEHCAALRIPTDPRRRTFEKWFNRRAA